MIELLGIHMRRFHNALAIALYVMNLVDAYGSYVLFSITEGAGDELAKAEGVDNVAGRLGLATRREIPAVV